MSHLRPRVNVGLVVFVVAMVFVVAASASSAASGSSGARIPARTFVDVLSAVPTNLDAALAFDAATIQTSAAWNGTLLIAKGESIGNGKLPGPFAVEPYLAESWKRTGAGYQFTLRKGVKSNYGNPLTTADVVWSWQRAKALSLVWGSNTLRGGIDGNNAVTVVDERTFVVNLSGSNAYTLTTLTKAFPVFTIYDSVEAKKHATDSDPWARSWLATHSASFGPYYVQGFTPGSAVDLRANPNHWAKPYFTRLILRAIPDGSVRLQLMLSGNATHTRDIEFSQFKSAKTSGKLLAETIQSTSTDNIFLNQSHKPLSDKRVRQALNLVTDRAAINNAVFAGFGTPATTNLPPSYLATLPYKAPAFSRDVAKARQLMAEAGYQNGFDVTVTSTPGTTGAYISDLLALLQQQWAQISVKVTVQVIATAAEYNALSSGGRLQAYVARGSSAVNSMGYFLIGPFAPTGTLPRSLNYSTARMAPFQNVLFGTASGPRYNRALSSATKIFVDDTPMIHIVGIPTQNVSDPGVKGYRAYTYPITYYEYLRR